MSPSKTVPGIRASAAAGIAAVGCYICFFLPIPAAIQRNFAFAFGPLMMVGLVGLQWVLAQQRDGILLRSGTIFGIVGAAFVNAMLVTQIANGYWNEARLELATGDKEREIAELLFAAVNRVQLGFDISFDIFIMTATLLLSAVMLRQRPLFPILGWVGLIAAGIPLSLNLYTFPDPPAAAGLFDAGPMVGLWFLAVFIRLISIRDLEKRLAVQ